MNGYRPARDLYTKEAPDALKLSYSLASLEKNWEKVAGSALASRTQLASCKITEEGIFITVNVADPGIIQAVKFRKNLLAKSGKISEDSQSDGRNKAGKNIIQKQCERGISRMYEKSSRPYTGRAA